MQEGSNAFDDGVVVSFCNTIMLRGVVNGEFLCCAL